MLKKILLFSIILLGFVLNTIAQNAIAISSDPGPGLHIAINWEGMPNAVKYNVYKKNEGDIGYPAIPLNPTPLVPLANCALIRAVLITSPDSAAWKLLVRGLADSFLFDPCKISSIAHKSEKYKRLAAISKSSMPVAVVAGFGYEDYNITNGKVYLYKVVALDASNAIVSILATDIKAKAGSFTPVAPPASLRTEAGDGNILIRWTDAPGAAGYIVERAPLVSGSFKRINESHFPSQLKNHLNGDTLIPASKGLLDFNRYSVVTGKDSSHVVKGTTISGPKNNSTYYYRVSSIDLFERVGPPSAVEGPVVPRDSTKPSVPIDLMATTDDISGHVTIRWTQVVRDINSHWEYPDSSIKYNLYRFTKSDDPNGSPSVMIAQTATLHGLKSRDTIDADPALRSAFGNRTWWYRVRAVDNSSNISQWSTAVSAIVKDITPPAIVKDVNTKGFEKYISVKWKQNSEPDIASYMIYRSLCHLGAWVQCKNDSSCKDWINYDPNRTNDNQGISNTDPRVTTTPARTKLPCPCSGPFVFLGELTKDSINRADAKGNSYFDDHTIPAGSPLCYAYWIKAKDSSDNISGSFPIPSPAEQNEIKCERLHDLTPPEPAIISGLFAEAEQIRVEWIGPPTQDTRAYHIYRAAGKDPSSEPSTSEYKWVGGVTIELPPTAPKILLSPYKAPAIATCDKISVQATPWMSQGFFEDKTVVAKRTYWYKVVGIDYDGNQTPLDKAAAISTFSFTKKIPDAPVIEEIVKRTDPCTVTVRWSPLFLPGDNLGFMVYKSTTEKGLYTPILTTPVTSNSYTDPNIVVGQTYWYKVAVLMANGRLSLLSNAQSVTP